ncbi:MAG: hypothetical protein IJ981_05630 [Clostridia bacterium]|nr:hypothetical protein [Clostridia bacterium]
MDEGVIKSEQKLAEKNVIEKNVVEQNENAQNKESKTGNKEDCKSNQRKKVDKRKKSKKNLSKYEQKKHDQKRKNVLWVLRVFFITLALASVFLVATESVIAMENLIFSFIILFLLLFISIVFDMIGTAAASCEIEPFISKASRKDKRAVVAVKLLQNAEKMTSFCNDIVGDICGIVSGGCASAIVIVLVNNYSVDNLLVSVIFSAVISAITVGGKAIGKLIGMDKNQEIMMFVASIIAAFKK